MSECVLETSKMRGSGLTGAVEPGEKTIDYLYINIPLTYTSLGSQVMQQHVVPSA